MRCSQAVDRKILISIIILLHSAFGRRHVLTLKNDAQKSVLCSEFGFSKGGFLSVSLLKLECDTQYITFTLDKYSNHGVAHFVSSSDECSSELFKFLTLSFDFQNKLMRIKNEDALLKGLEYEAGAMDMAEDGRFVVPSFNISEGIRFALDTLHLTPQHSENVVKILVTMSNQTMKAPTRFNQREIYSILFELYKQHVASPDRPKLSTASPNISLHADKQDPDELQALIILGRFGALMSPEGRLAAIPFNVVNKAISLNFTVHFPTDAEEGLYDLYLHNCGIRDGKPGRQHPINMTLKIVEKNPSSYLSVGDQPLPTLYFVICLVYAAASFVWIVYLRMSKNLVYKIHYLMFVVVLTKAISLAFHGVNYYVIGNRGVHEEGWAVMYYITHVIRGALLFITILLIGAGWAFIKHMLTPRERNVFIIVVPLQILANVATIVIEESEAGSARYSRWKDIFILMDLACCGAILFPVVWSIRHLQVASQTDGKAAINLRNLRMFRHFYILVICYVYFTRVIAYLLSITVNYSLTWVVELFKESVTFLFFVAVGFKFRPVPDNPYLLVSGDDDDDETEQILMERTELEDVWLQSGVTDGVFRLTRPQPHRKRDLAKAARSGKSEKAPDLESLLEPDSV